MTLHNPSRRLRVVVSDEETGEEVTTASGVETLIVQAVPDTARDHEYRRILVGDLETSVQLLVDLLSEMTGSMGQSTIVDLNQILDDHLLLEVTEELPPQ